MGKHASLYQSAWWQRARLSVLTREPLCRMCAMQGRTEPATVVDHIEPHRGDVTLFRDTTNLQPLCHPCHASLKQQQEFRGWHGAIGLDGMPVDPAHPARATEKPTDGR